MFRIPKQQYKEMMVITINQQLISLTQNHTINQTFNSIRLLIKVQASIPQNRRIDKHFSIRDTKVDKKIKVKVPWLKLIIQDIIK
jgi:hypothetical protein